MISILKKHISITLVLVFICSSVFSENNKTNIPSTTNEKNLKNDSKDDVSTSSKSLNFNDVKLDINEISSDHLSLNISLSKMSSDKDATKEVSKETKPKIFFLKNPERVVFDIPYPGSNWSKVINSSSEQSIYSLLRLGSNDKKLRIVADLKNSPTDPKYSFENTNTGYVLDIVTTENSKSKATKIETKIENIKKQSIKKENSEDSEVKIISTAKTKQEKENPTKINNDKIINLDSSKETSPKKAEPLLLKEKDEEVLHYKPSSDTNPSSSKIDNQTESNSLGLNKNKVSNNKLLKEINFIYLSPTRAPAIKLIFSEKSQSFTLTKKDESSYVLTFPEFGLSSDKLSLPLFPPKDFLGFTSVQCEQKDGNVIVTVSVDHGVKILSFPLGNEIVIRSSTR